MTPIIAEFVGATILLLLGSGVVANVVLEKTTVTNDSGWILITTGWAMAVYVAVVVAAPYSGAHLNPAVTVGLAMANLFPWNEVLMYVVAQLLGAMLGSTMGWLLYKDHFSVTADAGAKKAVFCTSPSIRNISSNLFSEALGTFMLVFAVLYFTDASIIDSDQNVGLGSLGAIPVAFVVWAIGLALGGTTGYAINPARDLGPRIMHAILPIKNKADSDWSYAWIPVVGPCLGGAIAAVLKLSLTI